MPVDSVPRAVTRPAPVISSGPEAVGVARAFAASIADGVIERDRSAAVPVRDLAALDASGLLGITVPRAYDGADLPATVLAEAVRLIAAVDPAIAQVPHDPVAWKYHHVGNYLLNGTLPPNHGQV